MPTRKLELKSPYASSASGLQHSAASYGNGKSIVMSIPLTTTVSGGKTVLLSNPAQPTRVILPEEIRPSSSVRSRQQRGREKHEEPDYEDPEEDEQDPDQGHYQDLNRDPDREENGEEGEEEEDVDPELIHRQQLAAQLGGDDEDEDEDESIQVPLSAEAVAGPGPAPKRKPRTTKVYPPSTIMFDQLIKYLCDLRDTTRKAITLARDTQKCIGREGRNMTNLLRKQKSDKPDYKPRGFSLPSLVSNEMVDYLLNVAGINEVDHKVKKQVVGSIRIERGCKLARHELISALCLHFRKANMRKNSNDYRDIYLDDVTAKLFNIDIKTFAENGGRISSDKEPIISYFDLQKYVPRHCGDRAVGH